MIVFVQMRSPFLHAFHIKCEPRREVLADELEASSCVHTERNSTELRRFEILQPLLQLPFIHGSPHPILKHWLWLLRSFNRIHQCLVKSRCLAIYTNILETFGSGVIVSGLHARN